MPARRHAHRSFVTLGVLVLAGPACAATVAETHGAWAVHVHDGEGGKLCFAASEPKERAKAANRKATAVYVSTWPAEAVKAEVSVALGYKIKQGSKVALTIGKDTFKLFVKDERAYVAEAAQEARLVEAIRKGASLTVEAMPEKGEITKDTYTLTGAGDAVAALAKICK